MLQIERGTGLGEPHSCTNACAESPEALQGARRYLPGALIGEGGSGLVYRATQCETGQIVAVKLLREDSRQPPADRARLRARFQREMALCERLAHPNVVALLDSGETADGRLFAVFEYVPGRTLREMLAAEGGLPAVKTGRLMAQVLDGLASAHRNGVVHRDLKPQNVMVTMVDGEPHAKILDFGIGTLLQDARRNDEATLTRTAEVLGSPQYCSPEQLRGEPPTVKSDLYAWGLLVIECLIGRPVMQGTSVAEILYQQLSPVDVALPPAIAAHPLGTVLRNALNKDPRQRAGSAEELGIPFRAIHFEALVGGVHYGRTRPTPVSWAHAAPSSPALTHAAPGRRQVTVLCCSVALIADGAGHHDVGTGSGLLDSLDACQAHWLTRCSDIAIRDGGQAGGMLGDTMLFYFGYPDGIDRPAQRACRAALEMTLHAARPDSSTHRAVAGQTLPGWRVQVAAAIHVGTVLTQASTTLTGITPSVAVGLQRLAPPGRILLSDDAARGLERYVDSVVLPFSFTVPGAAPQPVHELLAERYGHAQFESLDGTAAVPLVGRDRERDVLMSAWRRVVHGASREPLATLVVGEAGIGKSRLVHELRDAVQAQRHAVAECICLPERLNHALFPILRFVKAHWQIHADGTAEQALAALDRLVAPLDGDRSAARAALAAWLGLSGGSDAQRWSGSRQQQALFEVLCQLLASLGDGGPVLLVVEDAQWIDCASAEFLDWLLRQTTRAPLYVVLTSRPDELDRWRGKAERLTLRRLSRAETQRLVAALLPDATPNAAALEFLIEHTGGVPLFVEEVIRELVLNGTLAESGATLADQVASAYRRLPGSLREMLELMLERVDDARDTVQLAATIGLEVDAQLLSSASPHTLDTLENHLRSLLEARIVYARHRLGGVSYTFRHALIRETAYESMPAALRRANHQRVGQALSLSEGGEATARSASIAEHFARAEAFLEAVPYGIKAARKALERALHDDAIRYARAVLGWLMHCDYADQERDAVSIDLTLSHALMARFGWADPQVHVHAERVLKRVDALDDPQFAASALWTVAIYHHVAGDRAAVRRIGTQLVELAGTSKHAGLGVAANTILGMSLWIDGCYPAARVALEAALQAYDPPRDAGHRRLFGLDTRAWAMAGLASVMWCIEDDTNAALELAREAVYCATCTDHLPTIGVTMMYLARMQQCAGDRSGALATSGAILGLSRNYGLNAVERYAAIVHAWCDGDRAAALANIEALRASGCLLGLTYYASLVADLDAERADWSAAIRTVDECLALCDTIDERYYTAELLLKKARYLHKANAQTNRTAVEEIYDRAIAAAKNGGMSRIVKQAQKELRFLQAVVLPSTGA